MKDVLINKIKRFLGERWYIIFALLLLVIFIPTIIFYSDIKFSPSIFTTEWVKTGLTSIVLIILYKFFVFYRDTVYETKDHISFIDKNIQPTFQKMLEQLNNYQGSFVMNDVLKDNYFEDLKFLTRKLFYTLDLMKDNKVSDVDLSTNLKDLYFSLDIEELEININKLSVSKQTSENIYEEELVSTINQMSTVLEGLSKIKDKIIERR